MMARLYLWIGLVLLGVAGVADSRGWFGARPTSVPNVPQSIRDNPGAYRSIYQRSPRYFGGK